MYKTITIELKFCTRMNHNFVMYFIVINTRKITIILIIPFDVEDFESNYKDGQYKIFVTL